MDLGDATPAEVERAVLDRTETESSVVAIGNMGGQGAATVDWFQLRSEQAGG